MSTRYVPQVGSIAVDHTMLPDTDGRPVDNFAQPLQANLLTDPLASWLAERHPTGDFAIGRNSGIYWDFTDPPLDGCKAPDWFYVAGVPALLNGVMRRSYVLWREGVIPQIAIEFVSGDGSEERDMTPRTGKFWVYENAIQIPYYVIFDPEKEELEAFHLVRKRYRPLRPNAHGHFVIEPMGLALGLWRGTIQNLHLCWVRWHDRNGVLLPTADERVAEERRRAEQERQRAEQERQRAEQANRRAEQLAERLRALGIDPETLKNGH